MKFFDHRKIEKKWSLKWLKDKVYEPDLGSAGRQSPKRPFYNLMMFPYPSAEGLHVGNMYAFTGSDIYGRFKRMQELDVFEPIGLDGFGIHSENYALKIGKHPLEHAKDSEKNFYRQLSEIGNGFAWDERLETYDPKYYRWTQWLFTKMFKSGLAYRKKQDVNWCPSCKTVLADEQVISGECERCGTEVVKKSLEQWFFKITDYAERLLKNIEKLDWSEKVKIAQQEWIGKSEGAEIEFKIRNSRLRRSSGGQANLKISVFTTRPDTLFGATYMVLAPEHALLMNNELRIKNYEEVKNYINKAKKKADEERKESKDKTGVELKGVKAINPANKKEITIWVADYVLASYGTGAIMAVPAHDERDFEFAKRYKLPIVQVIEPEFYQTKEPGTIVEGLPFEHRDAIIAIVKHWSEDKYLALKWKKVKWGTFITGGIEKGQTAEEAARIEIREETGYLNPEFIADFGIIHGKFYHVPKQVNRAAHARTLFFELKNDKREEISREEQDIHEILWLTKKELREFLTPESHLRALELLEGKEGYAGAGIITNSDKFNGFDSEKAKWEITKFVGGKKQIQYHLRDWLISRQRYWGPPIPMIYCETCAKNKKGEREEMPGWYAVPEKDLPVELPMVKDFQPKGKGESPLASVKSFYEVKCPGCGEKARRETDVSDTFLDSSWYFLRYPSVSEKNHPWNRATTKKWLPVNMYIGGAEHSVLHLLYSRFMTMVAHDWGLTDFEEPFSVFRAHGLLIREGAKISKSKGNIVNPDEYIKRFGADTFRMYLMFLAPFEQGGDFRDASIMGISRFLERVWRFGFDLKPAGPGLPLKHLHQAIKKVTEDIEKLHYNTAISALMILFRDIEINFPTEDEFSVFLKLLAPFAPFMTEELWEKLGHKTSIHLEKWPEYDPKLIKEEEFELVIQVNGRLRDKVSVPAGIPQAEAEKIVLARDRIKMVIGKAGSREKVKKIIFVPGRLINIVLS